MFWPSFAIRVVIPIKFPYESNKPPPEEPSEIAAFVCIKFNLTSPRKEEIKPEDKVLVNKPKGLPIAYTSSPTSKSSNSL